MAFIEFFSTNPLINSKDSLSDTTFTGSPSKSFPPYSVAVETIIFLSADANFSRNTLESFVPPITQIITYTL